MQDSPHTDHGKAKTTAVSSFLCFLVKVWLAEKANTRGCSVWRELRYTDQRQGILEKHVKPGKQGIFDHNNL
jgi:hypothetical protein